MSNVPADRRFGTGQRNQPGLGRPIEMRRLAEFGECLRSGAASNPSSTSRWRVLATVATLVSSAAAISLSLQPSHRRGIGFQQNADLQQLLCWMFRYG